MCRSLRTHSGGSRNASVCKIVLLCFEHACYMVQFVLGQMRLLHRWLCRLFQLRAGAGWAGGITRSANHVHNNAHGLVVDIAIAT